MTSKYSPTDIWTVVDIAFNGWKVVSSHQWQHEAEAERDRRNDGLARRRYTASMAIAPIRQQADEARRLADPEAKQAMLEIAASYEQLAKIAEARPIR